MRRTVSHSAGEQRASPMKSAKCDFWPQPPPIRGALGIQRQQRANYAVDCGSFLKAVSRKVRGFEIALRTNYALLHTRIKSGDERAPETHDAFYRNSIIQQDRFWSVALPSFRLLDLGLRRKG